MKMHVKLATRDLESSVAFYSTLFNAQPVKQLPDYALFITEHPGLELALDLDGGAQAGDGQHFGIVVDSAQDVDAFTKTPKRATETTRHVVRPMTQPLKARHAASRGRLVLMSMSADKSDCHRCELGCIPRCGNSLLGVLSNLAVRIKRRLGHISNVDWLRVRLNHQITIDRARAIVAISQLALEME